MAKVKFEVGKRYARKNGSFELCTKRTDKSVWFDGYRYNITGGWGSNGIESTNYHIADNYDDIEVQSKRAIEELLQATIRVCRNKPCKFLSEEEAFVYQTANNLKEGIEKYLKSIEINQ